MNGMLTAIDELDTFFNERMSGACDGIANKITNLDPNLQSILLAQLQYNLFIHLQLISNSILLINFHVNQNYIPLIKQ
ncbi:unnamed protein product [Rotaria sp. Silwood2]|nr:unnamed protein product [Rotaria sp. Silwood2]